MVVPPIPTPKWSFLVGKPIVVGETHHFRKPPYEDVIFNTIWNSCQQWFWCILGELTTYRSICWRAAGLDRTYSPTSWYTRTVFFFRIVKELTLMTCWQGVLNFFRLGVYFSCFKRNSLENLGEHLGFSVLRLLKVYVNLLPRDGKRKMPFAKQ